MEPPTAGLTLEAMISKRIKSSIPSGADELSKV